GRRHIGAVRRTQAGFQQSDAGLLEHGCFSRFSPGWGGVGRILSESLNGRQAYRLNIFKRRAYPNFTGEKKPPSGGWRDWAVI
ncbi:hypothetical protein, partial [Achromobacter dolens]|uniref:hypothetical protein n=1 Tax=Achromobacter dolens TaxID=1287738 RepID=UPI001C2E0C52